VSAPAGPCEWCGGPQWWTIIRGEMYVACQAGCLPLPLDGLTPPSGSDPAELVMTPKVAVGTFEEGEGKNL